MAPMNAVSASAMLRVVRTLMSASGLELDQAIKMIVPEHQQDEVRAEWLRDRVTLVPPAVLAGPNTHPDWYLNHDPATGYYWPRLRRWLLEEKGRTESTIEAIDEASDTVLRRLHDPRPTSRAPQFQDRGLVLGYIQSGKTANFTAVIAKAYDAGFRIVIVLSGLHNSLRRQTQLRLEDELGLVPATSTRPGVGLPENGKEIIRMTRPEIDGDFNPGTADSALLQGTVPLIFVVKKNATVLNRIVEWLGKKDVPVPVLVVDDEADQGSINTGGNRPGLTDAPMLREEYDLVEQDLAVDIGDLEPTDEQLAPEVDPSVINGLVRQILHKFPQVSYVGYTATPFANILIDHEGVDREVFEDLYPKDFIVSLPKPHDYVGPEMLFGRDALGDEGREGAKQGLNVISTVSPADANIISPGRNGASPSALPASLTSALLDYFLALAARDHRQGGLDAGAMLIHGSPSVIHQQAVSRLIADEVAVLRQRWRYNRGQAEPGFRRRWNEEFRDKSLNLPGNRELPDFDQVASALTEIFRVGMPVLTLNYESDDELDYEKDPNLRAIVIGGNKLSRGLTIEGLLVSYYVRSANYYDTLLQMGRWFGYRAKYVDLTRLYTTKDLCSRFKALATAEEELRRDIRLYESTGKTPRDFGPRIRSHPFMKVTAPARMGTGRIERLDLSGTLVQTILFPFGDANWLEENLRRTRTLLRSLGRPDDLSGRTPGWQDVDWRVIATFMNGEDRYRLHDDSARSISQIWDYVEGKINKSELTRWRVSVRSRQSEDVRLGGEDLNIQGHSQVWRVNRSREKESNVSLGAIANPVSSSAPGGDEEVGLSADDRQWALANQSRYGGFARALRSRRDPQEGLLLIYPISPASAPTNEERSDKAAIYEEPEGFPTIVGAAWSFPVSEFGDGTEYIVGSVGGPR